MFESSYKFKGKHATIVKFLNKQTKQNNSSANSINIFNSAVEIYTIAPLIGVAYGRLSNEDKETNDETNIFADAMITHKANLEFVFRLVMLADETSGLTTNDQKIERAFKQDEKKENSVSNMNLFNSYARGGIEWLYEQITEKASNQDDYMQNIQNLVEKFSEDFGL